MNNKKPKIIFYGTPGFAVTILDALVKNNHDIAAVVTAPDKPAGRGKKLTMPPVKKYALEKGLNVLQPVNLKDPGFIDELKKINPDLQIVVAFRMLPKVVWELPALGTFNLHASLLPQYRGAAPINYAIINGEKETGLTTFFIDDKIDTGNIILQKKIKIEDDDDFETLHDKMAVAGASLVLETIDKIKNGNIELIRQEELIKKGEELKPAPKIKKEDCKINWDNSIDDIYNFIRGMSPWPGAFTVLSDGSGKEYYLKIFKTEKEKGSGKIPGSVETDNKTYLKISGKDGDLNIKELQLAGKKRMSTGELLRGFSFEGDVKAV